MHGFNVYPNTPNHELFRRKDMEVLIEGPAGTGKSMSALAKGVFASLRHPGSRILFCRKTRVSMNQTVLTTLEDKLLPMMMDRETRTTHGLDSSRNKSYRESYKVTCDDGDSRSEIVLAGLDDIDRLMSGEFDLIIAFEATELTENDWELLTSRLRNGAMPYQQIIGDCNPGRPLHWLNERFNHQPQVGSRKRLLSRHHHNPAFWSEARQEWTKAGVDYLLRLQNLTGARKERLLKGRWTSVEGLVYEFDRAIHVIPRFDIPNDWRMFWSVDFGIVHPFCAQLWAVDPLGRMIRVTEIYMTGRTVNDHAKIMKKIAPLKRTRRIVCDHALSERADLERAGYKCYPAIKDKTAGFNQVIEGLKPLADGKPGILFMEDGLYELDGDLLEDGKPTETLEEFDNYRRPVDKNGNIKELPVEEDDHGMDCLRYARMAFVKRMFNRDAPRVPTKDRVISEATVDDGVEG